MGNHGSRRALALVFAALMVGPGTVGAMPGMTAESTAQPTAVVSTVTAWVVEVTPAGDMGPLPGIRCTLVATRHRPGPHGGHSEVVGRWHARSDSAGRVQFFDVTFDKKAQLQVVVPFQGVAYRSDKFQRAMGDLSIRVYHVVPDSARLRMRGDWTIEVADSMFRVTQTVNLENPTNTTIDFTHHPTGFRVPTLSHGLAGERVVTHGIFPRGDLHGQVKPSTGQGRVVAENGAVVFRGPVPPGDGLFFRLMYNIPYEVERVTLSTVAGIPIREGVVSVIWTHRVHPQVRSSRPHRARLQEHGSLNRLDMLMDGVVEAGEPIVVHLDHLPSPSPLHRWVALAGGAGMVSVFVLLLIGARLRRRWASP